MENMSRKSEIKAMLQNMEATLEENRKSMLFNALPHYTLHKVLSKIAPQFYTKKELAQIDEINASYCQVMKGSTILEAEEVNNNERGYSSDEGSICYRERRRMKSKSVEKMEPKNQDKVITPSPPPKLPTLVENKIKELNGVDIKYILCTKLHPSDLDKQKNCLSMPINKENLDFLNNKKRGHSIDERSISHEERRVKPKPAKKREPKMPYEKIVSSSPPTLPILVENKIKELNGRDIKYVMRKKLHLSDLDKDLNRLSLPVELDYLNETEKTTLEKRDEKNKLIGLKVTLLDPCFREFSMTLKKWEMKTCSIYNLVKDWNLVLSKNKFKKFQELNIWSFRDVSNKLHFILDDNVNSEESEQLNNSVGIPKTS